MEVPIATTCENSFVPSVAARFGSQAVCRVTPRRAAISTDNGVRAAALILPTISSFAPASPAVAVPEGFGIKSTAPLCKAVIVSSAPSRVRELSIMTRVGNSSMIFPNASMPFISGISISIVTTSGRSSLTILTPSAPFRAVPITSISASSSTSRTIILRINSESSTTSTLIFPMTGIFLCYVIC
ncbi:hypothetical protein D1872_254920 [compost metagenome]